MTMPKTASVGGAGGRPDTNPITPNTPGSRAGFPGKGAGLLPLFYLPTLLLAALACNGGNYGINYIASDPAGHLLAVAIYDQSGATRTYRSADGGRQWQYSHNLEQRPDWAALVSTPRGRYEIANQGAEIVRYAPDDGQPETVYSVFHNRDDANHLLQARTEQGATYRLHSIHYDPVSDNIIAARGTEGIVIGTPAGQWQAVGVGPYRPARFSAWARTGLLLSLWSFWVNAAAMAAAFLAFAIILAASRRREIAAAGAAIAIIIGIVVAACALAPLALLVLAPAVGVTPFALQLTVAPDRGRRRALALTAVAMVLAGVVYSFPAFPGGFAPLALAAFWLFPAVYVPVLALAVALVAIAAGPYCPRRAPWAMVGIAAALIMLALVAAAILWLQYLLTMATARIAAVVAAAAIAMLCPPP